MKLTERILDMWLDMPSRSNWEHRQSVRGNFVFRRIIAANHRYGDVPTTLLDDIFDKAIISMGFSSIEIFESIATYDQLLECFEIALRYAKNWTFS